MTDIFPVSPVLATVGLNVQGLKSSRGFILVVTNLEEIAPFVENKVEDDMSTKNTKQTAMIKRIGFICGEFDSRREEVGTSIARLELAKALASCEASQSADTCCDRAGEYNGFGSDGPLAFVCPESCSCHD